MKRRKRGASYKSLGTSGVACWKFYEASIEQSRFETRKPIVVVEWLTPCFVFGRSRVQISVRRPAILTEVLRGFPPSKRMPG
jgi:hypothetical protein